MLRLMGSGRFRRMSLVILGWMLADWSTGARGQEGAPSLPLTIDLPRAVVPSSDPYSGLLERLRMMEQRLDRLTTHNETLMRENATLAERVQGLARQVSEPSRPGGMTPERHGAASSGVPAAGEDGTGPSDAAGSGAGGGSQRASPGSAGGGARTSGGGDPT